MTATIRRQQPPTTIRSGTKTQLIINFRVYSTLTHSEQGELYLQQQQQQQCLYLLSAIAATAMMTGSRVGLPLLAFLERNNLAEQNNNNNNNNNNSSSSSSNNNNKNTLYCCHRSSHGLLHSPRRLDTFCAIAASTLHVLRLRRVDSTPLEFSVGAVVAHHHSKFHLTPSLLKLPSSLNCCRHSNIQMPPSVSTIPILTGRCRSIYPQNFILNFAIFIRSGRCRSIYPQNFILNFAVFIRSANI
jgi:hypothetical protein